MTTLARILAAALIAFLLPPPPDAHAQGRQGSDPLTRGAGDLDPADETLIIDGGDAGEASEEARPKPPTTGAPAAVTFTGYLSDGAPPMLSEMVWRIFAGEASPDGSYRLLHTLKEPRPTVTLPPGEYLVNIAYGKANLTRRIGVWPEKPATESFVLNAGGLRLYATLARGPVLADHLLRFEVLTDAQDQFGNRQRILNNVRPGVVVRLNSGLYHIVSTYGDGNSVIASDVVVEPGRITEAVIDHDAAKVTLKLVARPGGEAVADTRWQISTEAGEVVKETAGAFPTHILAAGAYVATATHGDAAYRGSFNVAAGETKLIEVVMQ
jgi:preprotein translocase subunit YajC